jgi:hypothetical protein
MTRLWKAYWAAAGTALCVLAAVRNWKKYRGRSWWFIGGKAALDSGLVVVLAVFCPPLLVSLSVLWLLQFVKKDPVWQTVVAVFAGMGLMTLGGWALEILILIGTFSMDLLSSRILKHWRDSASC